VPPKQQNKPESALYISENQGKSSEISNVLRFSGKDRGLT
jgi:hypothetical protein